MAGEITTISGSSPPATRSWPEWLLRCESTIRGEPMAYTIPASAALTTTQRRQIEARRDELLTAAKTPATAEQTTGLVAGLLMAFPSATIDETTAKYRSKAYLTALSDLPAWAIEDACAMWLRRESGEGGENYRFAPTPPQLRRLAKLSVDRRVYAEAGRLGRILDAKPQREFTNEQRAAALAKVQAMGFARGAA